MIINDLHVFCSIVAPGETQTPLGIYADTILAPSVAFQLLQSVTRHSGKILKQLRIIEHAQFPAADALYRPELSTALSAE